MPRKRDASHSALSSESDGPTLSPPLFFRQRSKSNIDDAETGAPDIASAPMVWRRDVHPHQRSTIQLIPPNKIDFDKPVVILLPGINTYHDPTQGIQQDAPIQIKLSGYLKRLEHLLGGASIHREVQLFAVSYPTTEKENERHLFTSNNSPIAYCNDEAHAFVNRYLMPIFNTDDIDVIKSRLRHLTFFSVSYGAVFAQQVQVAVIDALKQKGVRNALIKDMLSEITLLASSNTSRVFVSNDSYFHSFFFMNLCDKTAEKYIGSDVFKKLRTYLPNDLSYVALKTSDNSLLMLQDDLGVTVSLFKERADKTVKIVKKSDPLGHTTDLYVTRRPETSVMFAIMQRVLAHAIRRSDTPLSLLAYLSPTPTIVKEKPALGYSLPYLDLKKEKPLHEHLSMVPLKKVPIIEIEGLLHASQPAIKP